MRQSIGGLVRRHVPLALRSYVGAAQTLGFDRASWDRDYATGRWAYLDGLSEMSRYAIIAGYIRTIGAAASVLDVGCGEGILFAWLGAHDGRRALGIDVSAVAIERARERAGAAARFAVGDATSFETDERFDVIVFNESLYYVDEPERALRRCEAYLEAGGAFIISMWQQPDSLRTWRRCAPQLDVLDEIKLRRSAEAEWHVRLCRPKSGSSAQS